MKKEANKSGGNEKKKLKGIFWESSGMKSNRLDASVGKEQGHFFF